MTLARCESAARFSFGFGSGGDDAGRPDSHLTLFSRGLTAFDHSVFLLGPPMHKRVRDSPE